jgi:hypothetical protein
LISKSSMMRNGWTFSLIVEIVHNIWLQQSSSNCGTCLYIAMFNNYIRAFKPFTLYRQYLEGGPLSHGFDRNELLLKRAQSLVILLDFVPIVANYMSRSSFTNCPLQGEDVFGFAKWLVNCLLGVKTMIPIVLIVWIFLIHE